MLILKMPRLSKGHNSGNIVYKVAFSPGWNSTMGGGGICYFPGGNSSTRKYHNHFSGGKGGILVAENHSRFSGG